MSLHRLLKDHQTKQAAHKKETEHLRKDAIQSAGQFTEALADTLSSRVSHIYANQKELEQGARNLAAQSARFTKQTQQWLALVEQFDSALKELGDVQNWVEVIEKDMEQVTAALEGRHLEPAAPEAST
ncbi:biogenesis of lysosome- organelles complex 1 subunit 1 [Actinomortierella ambigua]|nr:biogenesis of lysosome- organelles complex 1 subunit 1 [Actinomortierella ambigua]